MRESSSDAVIDRQVEVYMKAKRMAKDRRRSGVNTRPSHAMGGAGGDWQPSPADEQATMSSATRDLVSRAVQSHYLFSDVDKPALKAVMRATVRRTTRVGEDVIVEGQYGDHFYVITKGAFQASNKEEGS